MNSLRLGVLLWCFSQPIWASELQQAYKAYQANDFENALQAYQSDDSFAAKMGAGAASYRLKAFELAVGAFQQAAVIAVKNQARSEALFNLGNSYFQLQAMPFAIEAYEQALLYQPEFEAAKQNLELAKQQLQQQIAQQQRQGQNGEGEQGENGQGQGAGERAGKLDMNQAMIGGAGQSNDSGSSPEDKTPLPEFENRVTFDLSNPDTSLQLQDKGTTLSAQKIIINRQLAEQFERQLHSVDMNQKQLLKRLLEREEGFLADQAHPHNIPGIEPW